MKKPEIDLPAGSLQCALYAFAGGADAVYLGMKAFSARAGAVNFSFEDLRKLKTVCVKENKKFYIALNTLVQDDNIDQVIGLLKELEYLQPNGVILQDLGIVKIIRDCFPSLEMHTSTQLAVHTAEGVKAMQKLGFKRVVLARELSFEEIKNIKSQCPDVELKIFIHGAMCYGFSGLCMASQQITGRSANCGACAQICRTWFTCSETGKDGWFFSMKDMNLGPKIRDYAAAGVDSFKIEGRMKGPEYVYHAARYYRLTADGADVNSREVTEEAEALKTSFERQSCTGFFNTGTHGSCNCDNLICADYPSHRGIQVGTIDRVLSGRAVIRFTEPVALRDGLLVIYSNQNASFAVKDIEGGKSFVSAGSTVEIDFPDREFTKRPVFGTPVYCVSRHNGNLSVLNENIPLYKKPMDINAVITENSLILNGTEYPVDIQQAKTQGNSESVLRQVFSASDKSLFTLGNLVVENKSGFDSVFIPLSALKQIRRTFYEKLDCDFENAKREIKTPSRFTTADPLPSDRSQLGTFDTIVKIKNTEYLPLSPLMFNEPEYFANLERIIQEHPDIILGLNNIAQVSWASKHKNLRVFADIFMYTSNLYAYSLLKEQLPGLIGSYELDPNTPFTYCGKTFKVPLFISRVCFRHNSLGLSCAGCSKDNTYHLEQNSKHFTVRCKDCITTVTED